MSIGGLNTVYRLIACYHPSRQNTHTGKLTPTMLDEVFEFAKGKIQQL